MAKIVKNYDKSLKAKIALEAHKGEKSILEICSEYKVPKTNVHDWVRKLTEEVVSLFEHPKEKLKVENNYKKEIEKLHKIIGEITVENNYLKKKLDN